MDFAAWEARFAARVGATAPKDDPAHDLLHIQRVVANAKWLCAAEQGDPAVVIPAAWLHDLVTVPKSDPRRSQASRLSAEEAARFLSETGYPACHMDAIQHAIEAHSFSAGIVPESLEAKIVQDADRLDGIGAIGIARCFCVGGVLRRPFYEPNDPLCENRQPHDLLYTVDHFYAKLFKTAETMQTLSGKKESARRAQVMRDYLAEFQRELSPLTASWASE